MDQTTLAIAVTALIIWAFLLGFIIKESTETKKRLRNDQVIINLLTGIALKLGVPAEQVKKDVGENN